MPRKESSSHDQLRLRETPNGGKFKVRNCSIVNVFGYRIYRGFKKRVLAVFGTRPEADGLKFEVQQRP